MQRLSIEIINKMFRCKMSGSKINFLLSVSRYQDDSGRVVGAYYKDIAKDMGYSYPQFYAAMRELEKEGFIRCEKNSYYDYDIVILNNDYTDIYRDPEENLRNKPYINTGHDIFSDKEFLHMKPGAKLMAIDFMSVTRLNEGHYKIGVRKFFDKYQKLLGVTERIIRVYITQLKEFFSIGIKGGLYRIRPKVKVYKQQGGKTEKAIYSEQRIKATCRRNKITVEHTTDIESVRGLVKQYSRKALEVGSDILDVVLESVIRSVDTKEDFSTSEPVLKPKLIHIWVQKLLGILNGKKIAADQKPKSNNRLKNKFNNFHQRDYDMEALERALLNADT